MEKMRQGIHSLGRMLFAQCTEMINPTMSNGLPPNLTADPPSQSFIMKGVDVACAALVSELGFLANPVGTHVQTAEMGNQALNSLALVSARYTNIATDLLAKLSAAHILVVCQALDLRAMHNDFLSALEEPFRSMTSAAFDTIPMAPHVHVSLWSALRFALNSSVSMDAAARFTFVAKSLQSRVLECIEPTYEGPLKSELLNWADDAASMFHKIFRANYQGYLDHGNAAHLLGDSTRRMYVFVRQEIGIPFLHEGNYDSTSSSLANDTQEYRSSRSIGNYISLIHEAIRQGKLYMSVAAALEEARMAS